MSAATSRSADDGALRTVSTGAGLGGDELATVLRDAGRRLHIESFRVG